MIVVAHPDDETIGLGAQLGRFEDALLVHVTDGAPRDGDDARNYGFASVADYAAARRSRAGRGVARRRRRRGSAGSLSASPTRRPWRDLAGLARRFAELLRAERARCRIHACL